MQRKSYKGRPALAPWPHPYLLRWLFPVLFLLFLLPFGALGGSEAAYRRGLDHLQAGEQKEAKNQFEEALAAGGRYADLARLELVRLVAAPLVGEDPLPPLRALLAGFGDADQAAHASLIAIETLLAGGFSAEALQLAAELSSRYPDNPQETDALLLAARFFYQSGNSGAALQRLYRIAAAPQESALLTAAYYLLAHIHLEPGDHYSPMRGCRLLSLAEKRATKAAAYLLSPQLASACQALSIQPWNNRPGSNRPGSNQPGSNQPKQSMNEAENEAEKLSARAPLLPVAGERDRERSREQRGGDRRGGPSGRAARQAAVRRQYRSEGLNRLLYARSLFEGGYYERAAMLLSDFLYLFPAHPDRLEAARYLARIAEAQGDLARASNHYIGLYWIWPEREEALQAYLQAGRLRARLDQREEARQIFEQLKRRRPNSQLARLAAMELQSLLWEQNSPSQ